MELLIKKLNNGQKPNNEILADRAGDSAPKATSRYIVFLKGMETAYFELDRYKHEMLVYEIYVISSERNKGIGTYILNNIELIAKEEGYQRVSLIPKRTKRKTNKRIQEWID